MEDFSGYQIPIDPQLLKNGITGEKFDKIFENNYSFLGGDSFFRLKNLTKIVKYLKSIINER